MEKEFIPYVLSKQIKQLGFNEECFGYYVDVEVANPFLVIRRISNTQGGYFTLAPTFSQAFRFFREKYEYDGYFYSNTSYRFRIVIKKTFTMENLVDIIVDTYEEAELTCLKKLIEIVKNK